MPLVQVIYMSCYIVKDITDIKIKVVNVEVPKDALTSKYANIYMNIYIYIYIQTSHCKTLNCSMMISASVLIHNFCMLNVFSMQSLSYYTYIHKYTIEIMRLGYNSLPVNIK